MVEENNTDVLSSWFDGCDTVVMWADVSMFIAASMAYVGKKFGSDGSTWPIKAG